EDLVDLAPPGEGEQDPGRFWKDFIRQTAPEFRKPTIEQLDTWVKPVWQELIGGAKFCEPGLCAIIERTRPDVIIEDNVVAFPALVTAEVPFVRIVSCNPLEMKGSGVAPTFSGYPADDSSGWDAFRAEYDRTHRELWQEFDEWVRAQGAPALPDLEFIHRGDLNLYVYPEEADYLDRRPLDPSWHRIDSSVRETDNELTIPQEFLDRPEPLVYFSLGSLGSADVELMRRVLAVLAVTPYRFIVSKGPLHAEIELADNMWGAEQVPQTRVLPLCDLVMTHGGNNTTTESLHFGKPMIVLPLFWDQYDNAQRIHELGLGIRLDTYRFADEDLTGALSQLLRDTDLRGRVATIGADIRARNGLTRAADLVEELGRSALR
ncbi:MAG: nucleotide disphospho-sugar-binding domain-containing protein, partial [Candidatus Nanopelagicales bacterium]